MTARRLLPAAALLLWAGVCGTAAAATLEPPVMALRQFGEPMFKPGFTHFPHVNPDAPKGGAVTVASNFPPTFDNLNPIPVRGVLPRLIGLTHDPLMVASGWELDAAYARLAESVQVADDRSEAVFTLDARARWHDGVPVTAADVTFTWDAIQTHGSPMLKAALAKVTAVEAVDERRVRITLSSRGEIKPIIDFATVMAPEARHWWTANGRDIGRTVLEAPLGSGPYRTVSVDPGRSLSYERVADYWGRDLPVNRGLYNFGTIKQDFYRDDDVMFEAFKAGGIDIRLENRAQRWATGYDFPAVADGRVVKRVIPSALPLGAQAFRFNTRRPQFADPRVREALGMLFNFAWTQKTLLYGQYHRTLSNFPNSDYGASGVPGPDELALLEPYRDRLPPRLFTQPFQPPAGDPGGNNRAETREALRLLKEAGWEPKNGRLVNAAGQPLTAEFLEVAGGGLSRIIQPYVETLRRAGVDASLRSVDSAQYEARSDDFDFDVIITNFSFASPPATELRAFFGSATAGERGSYNYPGVRDPIVDDLVEKVIAARDEATLKTATRALDRVLLWSFYMVPHWYNPESWVAAWDRFGIPDAPRKYDQEFRLTLFPDTWWIDPAKTAKLGR